MAMRHPRIIVMSGAFSALATMSILSAILGLILPTFLPRHYTTIGAAFLFLFFGAVMLKGGIQMQGGNETIQEEMREVQKEVEDAEDATTLPFITKQLEEAEEGLAPATLRHSILSPPALLPVSSLFRFRNKHSTTDSRHPALQRGQDSSPTFSDGIRYLKHFINPVLLQIFVMTFLAEWGDRSQISTIALAAGHVSHSFTQNSRLGGCIN